MPKLLLFLLICFFSGPVFAVELRFSHLGIQQGGIDALTQDKYGFIWIGTRNGLVRYDGNTITSYRNIPDKPDTLQEDAIIALHYGKDGRLWIGTAENGASYYNYTTGKFTRISTDTTAESVYSFYDDESGQGIYAQTTKGLFFIDLNDQVKKILSEKYSELILGVYSDVSGVQAILETGQVLALGENSDQPEVHQVTSKKLIGYWQTEFCPHLIRESTLVAAGSGLLYCLRGEKVIDVKLNKALFLAGINPAQLQVYDLVEDNNGIIWMSSNLGLLRIAGIQLTILKSTAFNGQSLSGNKLSVLLAGQQNTLFVGTQDQGLNILNLDDSGLTYFNTVYSEPVTEINTNAIQQSDTCQAKDEMESPVIWATLKDTDGHLWVGNQSGLFSRPLGSDTFQQHNRLGNNDSFIDLCAVLALAGADGKIWIGTRSGLLAYDKYKQTFKRYRVNPENTNDGKLSGNTIRVLLYDRKRNSLWIGTDQAGLKRIDLNSREVQHFPYAEDDQTGLPHAQVHSLYLDHKNHLWVGTTAGLSLWDEDSDTFRTIHASDDPATLSDATVLSIHQSGQGKLWLGTGNGLNLFDINQFRVEKRWFERDGLPNPSIYRIVSDNFSHYWLNTANGLSRFDPVKNSFSNYYPQHETQSSTVNINTWFKEKEGLLYLGGIDGLSVINPLAYTAGEKLHPPLITRVDELDDEDNSTELFQMLSADSDGITKSLARNIRLNFTYPFFGDGDLLRSQYRLLPATDTWSETYSGSNYVDYIDLQPGTYEFQLKANLAGEQISSFRFDIQPYFWETVWFRLLALIMLLILTIFMSIYAYRVWGKFSAEKMTRQHYRIVEHELRPHLYEANKQLQSLMQSPGLSIKDKQLIRFSVMPLIVKSIDFIAELRTLVDLRRTTKQPKQLYMLEDVLDEVALFFRDYQQRIVISEVEDINILTHQDAVYLLVKNLISNAIKYSPGGEPVSVNVSCEGKTLIIECIDQGIGISKDKRKAIYEPYKRFVGEYKNINGQGIGLAIVRFIVHTYQGNISIADNQPQGSRFTIRLKGVVADEY